MTFEQETELLCVYLYDLIRENEVADGHLLSSRDSDKLLSCAERLAAQAALIEQQEMELEILRGAGGNFSFTPSDDYNLLLKQSQAMACLIRSLEGQRDIQTARMIGMERRLAETDRSELDALRNTNEMLTNEAEQQAATVTGLLHNLSVIEGELKQIKKEDCGGQAWNRISLAIEFAEQDKTGQ